MIEELFRFPTIDSILAETREYDPDLTLSELARIFERFMPPGRLGRMLAAADNSANARGCIQSLCRVAREQLQQEAATIARLGAGRSKALRRSQAIHCFDPPGPHMPTIRPGPR